MKKSIAILMCMFIFFATTLTCFAQTSPVQPRRISNWHYQNDTPLVGNASQYSVQTQSPATKDLTLPNYVRKVGLAGLASALGGYLPNPICKGVAAAVMAAVVANPYLDTPSLYYKESVYGMKGSESLNYKVVQVWYKDKACTSYITTTTYYVSFY